MVPGALGLITPLLLLPIPMAPWLVVPVPILLLEAPVPRLPESDVVAAMPGWGAALVLLVALLSGAVDIVCARARLPAARLNAMAVAKTIRDMVFSSDGFWPPNEGDGQSTLLS